MKGFALKHWREATRTSPIKIKITMILCALSMSKSREQSAKRRSSSERFVYSIVKVTRFCDYQTRQTHLVEKFTRCAKVCGQIYVNKTNFHMKGFTLGLALKQRRKVTRTSPIDIAHFTIAREYTCSFFIKFTPVTMVISSPNTALFTSIQSHLDKNK